MHIDFKHHWKLFVLGFVLLCFGGGAGLGYYQIKSHHIPSDQIAGTTSEQPSEAINADSIPTPPPDLDSHLASTSATVSSDSKQLSILVLGYGGAGHEGGYLSDTIILAYLDVTKKKVALIHIPRDTWVTVQVGNNAMPMKINGALAMGTKTSNYPTTTLSEDSVLKASSLTKQAVTTITGLPIDFVVGVDFNGFAQAINKLNGIKVHVPTVLDDPWYPVKGRELELCGHTPEEVTQLSNTLSGFALEKQFPCRYEHLHFDAGTNFMDGETALKYGRSRHSSSDFARGMRQIAIVRGVVDKLFSLEALDSIPAFYSSLTKAVKTDVSLKQLTIIAPILKTIPSLEVVEIGLDTANVLTESKASTGAFILKPKAGENNWQATQEYITSRL